MVFGIARDRVDLTRILASRVAGRARIDAHDRHPPQATRLTVCLGGESLDVLVVAIHQNTYFPKSRQSRSGNLDSNGVCIVIGNIIQTMGLRIIALNPRSNGGTCLG